MNIDTYALIEAAYRDATTYDLSRIAKEETEIPLLRKVCIWAFIAGAEYAKNNPEKLDF